MGYSKDLRAKMTAGSSAHIAYLRQAARRLDFAASSQTRSARAHITRGIAEALLDDLGEAKRLGHAAALELRRALEMSSRACAVRAEAQQLGGGTVDGMAALE